VYAVQGNEQGGPRCGRRDGTEGSRVVWELGHKRPQHAKAQQAKAYKAARKQGAATSATSAETQTHMHPTEGEGSGGEPVVPRGPEWVDEHVRRPSPPHWSVLSSRKFGQQYIRSSPCWRSIIGPNTLDNASLPRPESAVELDPVLILLPLDENRLPQVSLTSFSSHQGTRKCSITMLTRSLFISSIWCICASPHRQSGLGHLGSQGEFGSTSFHISNHTSKPYFLCIYSFHATCEARSLTLEADNSTPKRYLCPFFSTPSTSSLSFDL